LDIWKHRIGNCFSLLFSVSLQRVLKFIATGRNRSGSLSQEATSELDRPVRCFPATERDGDRIRRCLHGPLLRPAVLQRGETASIQSGTGIRGVWCVWATSFVFLLFHAIETCKQRTVW